jgi:hypothetical protein
MQRVIQHIYILPLLLSMLLSLKVFRLRWPTTYKVFSLLLIFVSAIELVAILWKYLLFKYWGNHPSNIWIYNLFLIPQYLLYLYFYYLVLESIKIKKLVKYVAISFSLFGIINLLFIQTLHQINSFTLIFSSIMIIFLTAIYFEQVRKQKEIISLSSNPLTWISLGAFIFHSAYLPYISSLNYLIKNNIPLALALYYIFLGLNCLMYSLYLIAFLCRHPHLK